MRAIGRGDLPALGNMVSRARLLEALESGRPTVLLACAPAGYGKTSLALQFALAPRFSAVLWVDGAGQEYDDRTLLQYLVWQSLSSDYASSSVPNDSDASLMSLERQFAESLGAHFGTSLCIVMDNMLLAEADSSIQRLESILRTSLGADYCLVITTRSPLCAYASARTWYLESEDLRFDENEAIACACAQGVSARLEPDIVLLHGETAGHPALFAVMARSLATRGRVPRHPGEQITRVLEHLAQTQLDDSQLRLLAAASMLGSGRIDDLSDVLQGSEILADLQAIARHIPLLRVETGRSSAGFFVHDVARAVFRDTSEKEDSAGLLGRCLNRLADRGDLSQCFELALAYPCADIEDLVGRHGRQLLRSGGLRLLRQALERMPRSAMIREPHLLLLEAEVDKICGNTVDARRKARLAGDLAEHEESLTVAASARGVLARILMDQGRSGEAREVLQRTLQLTSATDASRAALFAYLAAVSANLGDGAEVRRCLGEAQAAVESGRRCQAAVLVRLARAFSECVLFGDFRAALEVYAALREVPELDIDMLLCVLLNAATASCYTGRLGQAVRLLEEAERRIGGSDVRDHVPALLAVKTTIAAGRGQYEEAERAASQALASEVLLLADACYLLIDRARWRRVVGDLEASLADAEEARDRVSCLGAGPLLWQAEVELQATLLRMGDAIGAQERARTVFLAASAAQARRCAMLSAMVVSEAQRLLGEETSLELSSMREYLHSGNANWDVAMYARSFPALIPQVAKIVGPERLPAHLTELLRLDGAQAAITACKRLLTTNTSAPLLLRLGGGKGDALAAPTPGEGTPGCRVQLLGGLQLTVGDRSVSDSDWKKRKARLLFAMLVVRKGKDVPREQLLEYLWPEMDEARARANFYVIWNNMKRALSPDAPKGAPCPYVRAAHGVCRADDILVTSDLDDFERCMLDARRAEVNGDSAQALASYRRLAEIYRGDLLPGDIYDDWFAPLRERCRQEFGDAMLRGGQILEEQADYTSALHLIRSGLAHDPWREDLYQAALRCQIAAGQRSAAIDTYMACRHKLTEDLGIDPSAETKALYDRVLAMEDGPGQALAQE